MTQTTEYFLSLLRYAVGSSSDCSLAALTQEEWEEVLKLAQGQSVLSLLRCCMTCGTPPPLGARSRVNFAAELTAGNNRKLTEHIAEIAAEFQREGFRCCLLKGQGLARMYPDPTLRQGGDIDLWVIGERSAIMKYISGKWKPGTTFYHHTEIRPFSDKTEVEVHFTPSWMNNPFRNRRLQKYFRTMAHLTEDEPALGCPVPTTGFNLVYCAVHIYRHLLSEGVGLRQITDYYFLLRNASPEDRCQAVDVLTSLGMRSFAGALMYVEKELYLLPGECFICPPDSRFGQFFLDEIFLAGNFGRSDTRYSHDAGKSLIVRAFRQCRRLSHLISYAPSEVIWAPYFKIWQRIRYIRK